MGGVGGGKSEILVYILTCWSEGATGELRHTLRNKTQWKCQDSNVQCTTCVHAPSSLMPPAVQKLPWAQSAPAPSISHPSLAVICWLFVKQNSHLWSLLVNSENNVCLQTSIFRGKKQKKTLSSFQWSRAAKVNLTWLKKCLYLREIKSNAHVRGRHWLMCWL